MYKCSMRGNGSHRAESQRSQHLLLREDQAIMGYAVETLALNGHGLGANAHARSIIHSHDGKPDNQRKTKQKE